MSPRGQRPAVLLLAAVLLTGCDFILDANRGGFYAMNRTDQILDLSYVEKGTERVVYHNLNPDKLATVLGVLGSGKLCTNGDIVARDRSGLEVARRTEPICNHEEWTITGATTPGSK